MERNEIVLFEYNDIRLEVPVTPEQETVWLNRAQMSELFGRDIKTIGKHIANVLRDELEGQVPACKRMKVCPFAESPFVAGVLHPVLVLSKMEYDSHFIF